MKHRRDAISDSVRDHLSISENEPRFATKEEAPRSGTIIPDADHPVSDGARCPSCTAYLLLNKPKNCCPLCGARLPKYEGNLNPDNELSGGNASISDHDRSPNVSPEEKPVSQVLADTCRNCGHTKSDYDDLKRYARKKSRGGRILSGKKRGWIHRALRRLLRAGGSVSHFR